MIEESFSTDYEFPDIESSISVDLREALDASKRLYALYAGVFEWFQSADDCIGLAKLDVVEGNTSKVVAVIDKIFDVRDSIKGQSKYGIFTGEFHDEVIAARKELTGKFVPPVENRESLCVEKFSFSSAFLFTDELYGVFSEVVLRRLWTVRQLAVRPENCTPVLARSTVGCELMYLYGCASSLPRFDHPSEVVFELIREITAVENRRQAGRSWEMISSMNAPQQPESISAKVRTAYDFVVEKGPVKAVQIANHLKIEESSFYRHYVRPLRSLGVVNDRRNGYVARDLPVND